jgi:hypothetical protein
MNTSSALTFDSACSFNVLARVPSPSAMGPLRGRLGQLFRRAYSGSPGFAGDGATAFSPSKPVRRSLSGVTRAYPAHVS